MLGAEEVVLRGEGEQVLRRRGVLAAVLEHPVQHVVEEDPHLAELFHALVGDAVGAEPVGIDLFAPQVLLGLGQLLVVGGLVLLGELIAVLQGLGGHHVVQHRLLLGAVLDVVGHGHAVAGLGGPVQLGPAQGLVVGGGLRGALAQPEEEVPGGDLAAVDGEHHGLAGDPALFAHHLLDGVLRGGAADAAAEHAHRHGQGKGGGQGFLYESVHRNDTPCVPIEMGFRGGKLSLHRGAFYHDFPFVTTLFPKIHGWFTGSSHLVDIFPAAA